MTTNTNNKTKSKYWIMTTNNPEGEGVKPSLLQFEKYME